MRQKVKDFHVVKSLDVIQMVHNANKGFNKNNLFCVFCHFPTGYTQNSPTSLAAWERYCFKRKTDARGRMFFFPH